MKKENIFISFMLLLMFVTILNMNLKINKLSKKINTKELNTQESNASDSFLMMDAGDSNILNSNNIGKIYEKINDPSIIEHSTENLQAAVQEVTTVQEETTEVETETTEEETTEMITKKLNSYDGVHYNVNGNKETYYNLPMRGVIKIAKENGIEGDYWVRNDGVKMYGDYIIVAANLNIYPRGTIVETSLGTGIVLDTGDFVNHNKTQFDIAVTW